MFAHSGGGASDDPYNFDIADGFGGGASKRNNKKSKLGKSFLHKTAGASVGASSLAPQDSSTATTKLAAARDVKDPIRASAPAAPPSALDKAMSFLNKYSSSAAPSKAATERTFRKSSDVPRTTFDEDELDLSLSSDSDAGDWKPGRKAPARRDKLTPEPQEDTKSRALTGMRTSARFSTAKELGISGPGKLGVPKAAVSPVGLMQSSANISAEGAQPYQTDNYSASEARVSGLRLAVNIPGGSSPNASLIRSGSKSDVDSIISPSGEALEEKTPAEAEESEVQSRHGSFVSELASSTESAPSRRSSSVSPILQQHSESARTPQQDSQGFARVSVTRGSLGNTGSFDTLGVISGHDGRANVTDNHRRGRASVVGKKESYTTDYVVREEEEDDDDYGDDDFEDQDVLMESNGEKPDGEQISGITALRRGNAETAGCDFSEEVFSHPPVPVYSGSPAPTTQAAVETLSDYKKQHEVAGSTAGPRAGRQERHVGATDRIGEREKSQDPREAWSATATNGEKARVAPVTIDSGTSPGSRMQPDSDWKDSNPPGNSPSVHERAPSAIREAWGDASPAEPPVNGRRGDVSVVEGTENQGASTRSVSKRGVLMDRSSEARNGTRPSGVKVKVVVRAETVSSVEYAHDPERELDLRSCGTQMVGNSAAVQANIAVPGMAGTASHVCNGCIPRGTRTAGVGYGLGEAYAKWGRFACEAPLYPRGGFPAGYSTSLNLPRRHRRSAGGAEPDNHVEPEKDDPFGGGGSGTDGVESYGDREDGGAAQLQHTVGESSAAKVAQAPPARGGPAYFEMFSNIMGKSHESTCYPWQHILGEAAPPRSVSSPSGTADVADDPQPGIRDTPRAQMQECFGGTSEVDVALHEIMAATQDSFKTQLADMRESLNKIRYRAEIAGRCGQMHQYESLTGAREFLARARPRQTSPAEALRTVDPSLSVEQAEALAGDGTVPPSPVEPHLTRARGSTNDIEDEPRVEVGVANE